MKFFTRSVTQNPFSLSPGRVSCVLSARWPSVSGVRLEDTLQSGRWDTPATLRRPPTPHACRVLCSKRVPSRVTPAFSYGVSLVWRLAEFQSFPDSRDLCASEIPMISWVALVRVLMPCSGAAGAPCASCQAGREGSCPLTGADT